MDKPAADFADHRIETADLVVNYLREGSGPPLVLLHGWPEFCRSWKKNITALAERFDVIAPDLRGFGDTRRKDGKPAEKTTAGLLSDDLTAFLDALGVFARRYRQPRRRRLRRPDLRALFARPRRRAVLLQLPLPGYRRALGRGLLFARGVLPIFPPVALGGETRRLQPRHLPHLLQPFPAPLVGGPACVRRRS